MEDHLIRGTLSQVDPEVYQLTNYEKERQFRKLIMIPSESTAPQAIRESLGSVFQNIYAEGYPDEETRWMSEAEILDYPARLSYYRRYADPRYYKGVEYADVVEALARRRCAEAFATDKIGADQIFVNVQPLSGAPANNAVYTALIEPGDTILGMNLLHGGHLTHGSSVNRSGKLFKVAHYNVDPVTEMIDYDKVEAIAREAQPKVIICGYSSYPWIPDWARFRAIADSVGAYLLADVSHIAGLIAGKAISSPVGYAHVITFTTHKTLLGPRGACILTTDSALAKKLDKGVFPGEQGGPHVHVFAALATTFKLAKTPQFAAIQNQIINNCAALTNRLSQRGLRISYGGTNSHLVNLDCKTIKGPDGTTLSGDMAARILDVAGIVLNRNTIPGDKTALYASGIRFGTPWLTQRGLVAADMDDIASIVRDVLTGIRPYFYQGLAGELPRGKIDLNTLKKAQAKVAELADRAGIDFIPASRTSAPSQGKERIFLIKGFRAKAFLQEICTGNLALLSSDKPLSTFLLDRSGGLVGEVTLASLPADSQGRDIFLLKTPASAADSVKAWLEGLSDGYVLFDESDVFRKVQGPVTIAEVVEGGEGWDRSLKAFGPSEAFSVPIGNDGAKLAERYPERFDLAKTYFVGQDQVLKAGNPKAGLSPLPEWKWNEAGEASLKRTVLYEAHKKFGAKLVPFAGWEMPVWYTSVSEEHAAVRNAAGLFDVSHMGAFEVSGPNAIPFLDTVGSNYAHWLEVGQSCYGYLLDPHSKIIDDFMIYRRRTDSFLLVVNASNEDKDWDWLNAVNKGRAVLDIQRPWVRVEAPAVLRNLKDPASGKDQLRDIALQGPASLAILQACTDDPRTRFALSQVKRTDLIDVSLSGILLVAARTGYTGEEMGFEIFIHPDQLVEFWNMLLEKGKPFGILPCGLAARDSTRTEAGLPLYGHELAGPFDITPAEAGFAGYVKYHKPFFVGRDVLLKQDLGRTRELVRWRMNGKGVRRPGTHAPLVNRQGQMIGYVTSCSIDSEGVLMGLGIVDIRFAKEGTPIGIFVLPEKAQQEKQKPELEIGDKVLLHVEATILRRFPEKRKSRG